MTLSVFDMFTIGVGPSSSHTVGPMRAARRYAARLAELGLLERTHRVRTELYGSLGRTGVGHGTVDAVVQGLAGADPETVDPRTTPQLLAQVAETGRLALLGTHPVGFVLSEDVLLRGEHRMPFHSNAMRCTAYDAPGQVLDSRVYYSVGGGFVLDEDETEATDAEDVPVPYPFSSGQELLVICEERGLRIPDVVMANEQMQRSADEVRAGLLHIWSVMADCVERGWSTTGTLPGGLGVRRRAAHLRDVLLADSTPDGPGLTSDPLGAMEWTTVTALAVNEENAAGGRVVTAPTNGAAGIIPAVLGSHLRFAPGLTDEHSDDDVVDFLLTAAAVGMIIKARASISGAEVGCQGEVGSACAMAAAGLAQVLGGKPQQVEMAAEIGLEHNLGLTCDPVAGLVQVPCIERNALASIKAIAAARLAVREAGDHFVSLDTVIETMRQTGADMSSKYKETALGGLAVNVVEC